MYFEKNLGSNVYMAMSMQQQPSYRGPACGVCPPDLLLMHPDFCVILICFYYEPLYEPVPVVSFIHVRHSSYLAPASVE